MKLKLKFRPVEYKKDKLIIIDQTKLPEKLIYKEVRDYRQLGTAIKRLMVRGAPLLGVVAGYGIALGLKKFDTENFEKFYKQFKKIAEYLKSTRPTAVNLFYAIDRIGKVILTNKEKPISHLKRIIEDEAERIYQEDLKISYNIGINGAKLIKDGYNILTHCNAGGLATAGLGTALACMFVAKQQGKSFKVFVDETRPLWQGARLTTWELLKWGIDTTLICDDMAAFTIKKKKINLIIVGADRIAGNGDTANKIGTYNLAILAKHHKIPFYVAAPSTTFDFNIKEGEQIPIEQRGAEEVVKPFGKWIAPVNVKTFTPAFDVTPATLISGFITEKGILKPPFKKSFKKLN